MATTADPAALFEAHTAELTARYVRLLDHLGLESIWLVMDRNSPHVQPHLRHWLDLRRPVSAALRLRRSGKHCLYVAEADLPKLHRWQAEVLHVEPVSQRREAWTSQVGCFASPVTATTELNLHERLDVLHLRRTPYELACVRTAVESALRGHESAREAFFAGAAPDEVLTAFLEATAQERDELPYPPIVAFGRDATAVHPTAISAARPRGPTNVLLDLGARAFGYVADVTRSYATSEVGKEVTEKLRGHHDRLIASLSPGQAFFQIHTRAHRTIAELLRDLRIIKCSPEDAMERGITEIFFPHGTGHYIGVDVHAAGGLFTNDGKIIEKPATLSRVSILRRLDLMETFTIEPGIYFDVTFAASHIPPGAADAVDWNNVTKVADAIGGARFEDMLFVGNHEIVRMT